MSASDDKSQPTESAAELNEGQDKATEATENKERTESVSAAQTDSSEETTSPSETSHNAAPRTGTGTDGYEAFQAPATVGASEPTEEKPPAETTESAKEDPDSPSSDSLLSHSNVDESIAKALGSDELFPSLGSIDSLIGVGETSIDDLVGFGSNSTEFGDMLNLGIDDDPLGGLISKKVSAEPEPKKEEPKKEKPKKELNAPLPDVTFPPQQLKIKLNADDLDLLLQRAINRDTVFKLGLYFIAGIADQAAIFTIPGNRAAGYMLHGPEELQEVFKHISISLESNTIFRKLKDSLVPYAGPMPGTVSDRVFFALFDPPPQTVYFFPVRLRGRNVCMLYGHRLEEQFSNSEYESLIRCIQLMSNALERVIVARKKGIKEDPAEITKVLNALWADDGEAFEDEMDLIRPDDFMFEAPIVLENQKDLVAAVEHVSHAPAYEEVPGLAAEPPVPSESEPVEELDPPAEEQVELHTLPSTDTTVEDAEESHMAPDSLEEGGVEEAEVSEEESDESLQEAASEEAPQSEPIGEPLEEEFDSEEQPSSPVGVDAPESDSVGQELASETEEAEHLTEESTEALDSSDEWNEANELEALRESEPEGPSSQLEPEVESPEVETTTSNLMVIRPSTVPLGRHVVGGEYLSPMINAEGAEVSASYVESIPILPGFFDQEFLKSKTSRPSAPPPPPTSNKTRSDTATQHENSSKGSNHSDSQAQDSDSYDGEPSPTASHDSTSSVGVEAQQSSQGPGAEGSTESSDSMISSPDSWSLVSLKYDDLLIEEMLPPSTNPDGPEHVQEYLPLPEDMERRETALNVIYELEPKERVLALLQDFPGNLNRQDLQQDGTLLFEVSQTASGEMWNILLEHPEETLIGIQPYLYHNEHNTRLLAMYMLKQLDYEPLLIHLTRFLLDSNPAISQKSSQLLNLMRDTREFKGMVSWLRQGLEKESGPRLARTIRLLTKLRDSLCVPELIELLAQDEPGLTPIVHAALIDITKQTLPPAIKKWNKWWRKLGSRTERIDWLIEGIQQKDAEIVNASWLELRDATGQNFGFAPDAARRQRNEAIKNWKRWRKQQLT